MNEKSIFNDFNLIINVPNVTINFDKLCIASVSELYVIYSNSN